MSWPRRRSDHPTAHVDTANRARDITDPIPTLTRAKRGELAFITTSLAERDSQLPCIHDLEMPMPTIPAKGSVRMVPGIEGEPQYDILFRMLHSASAPVRYHSATPKSITSSPAPRPEIINIGNAVPVRTARALVGAAPRDMVVG